MPAVVMEGVTKTYRGRRGRPRQKALDDLDLLVESGGVHGFLGPNGSGKTTSIRVLLGLVAADSGTARIFDRPVPDALPEVIGHVGALVETPLFFPNFSGRRNLQLLAEVAGVPRTRIDECLDIVDLRDRAGDRFKGYSLGMKQRLGIAAALLKQPRLLILDEPSNGLDPAGMKEMRDLVRELGTGGRTVFLSSHLLGEVQQVCDRVSILSRGRCLVQGPVGEVLRAHAGVGVTLAVDEPNRAYAVLRDAGYDVYGLPDGRLQVGTTGRRVEDPATLTRLLGEQGLWLRELQPQAADLESAFLEITGGNGAALGATPTSLTGGPA